MCYSTAYTCVAVSDPLLTYKIIVCECLAICTHCYHKKMMKIVWSIICLQYFGSINKMNLKSTIQFYHTVKYSVTQKEERLRERKILSLSLSFLCVIYLREKSVSIKTQKRFFLVSILIWLKIQSFEYLANFCHKSRRLKLSFKTF